MALDAQIAGTQDAAGLNLGAPGVAVGIARAHVTYILGVDECTIELSRTSDKVGSSGEVMRLHGSFIVSIENSELVLRAFAADGPSPC